MSHRACLAVPFLLLLAGLLPAQLGVGPILARPLAINQVLTPPGAVRVTDYTIRSMGNGSFFVGATWQQTLTGPRQLGAFDYSKTTNTKTPRNDFSGVAWNTESISISQDLLTVIYYEIGYGPRVSRRPSIGAPWSAGQPIGGLATGAFGLEFCSTNGGTNVIALFNDAMHAPIEVLDYDPLANSVSNPVPLFPHLGQQGNFVACVIPLDDIHWRTRGVAACIRGPVGNQQQWQHCGGVDSASPWQPWFNNPPNTFFTGGDQFEGGYFIGANAGFSFGTPPPGGIDMYGTFTCDTTASAQGGPYEITVFGPPGDFGVAVLGLSLGSPMTFPPLLNSLGIDPSTIVATLFQPMTDGEAQWQGMMQAFAPVTLPLQGASLGANGQPSVFGDTGWFRTL